VVLVDLETDPLRVFLAPPGGTGRGESADEVEAPLPGRFQRGPGKMRGRQGGGRTRGKGGVQPPGVPTRSVHLILGGVGAEVGIPGPGKGDVHRRGRALVLRRVAGGVPLGLGRGHHVGVRAELRVVPRQRGDALAGGGDEGLGHAHRHGDDVGQGEEGLGVGGPHAGVLLLLLLLLLLLRPWGGHGPRGVDGGPRGRGAAAGGGEVGVAGHAGEGRTLVLVEVEPRLRLGGARGRRVGEGEVCVAHEGQLVVLLVLLVVVVGQQGGLVVVVVVRLRGAWNMTGTFWVTLCVVTRVYENTWTLQSLHASSVVSEVSHKVTCKKKYYSTRSSKPCTYWKKRMDSKEDSSEQI